jgi:hypothetical protein
MGDHDNVGRPFDLGHGGAHAVVAEAVNAGVYTPVGGPEHPSDRTAAPRWRGCRLAQGNTGEGSLGNGVERRIRSRDVGAERLVKDVLSLKSS